MILLLSMKKQRVLYRSWPIFLLLCWYLDNCASLIVLRKNLYVKDDNLHRYHIRQGVAEDPGLMHRVKKVAFRTRLQSGLSPRVYNHHFFTRNNSLLDLNWQCHAPKLMNVNQECHLLFCHSFLPLARHWCLVLVGTPEVLFLYQHISYSIWYTRNTSPVPMVRPSIFDA